MKKVSVIIPVYNTEKYLDKCLKSVVNQTLKNIEIIVINDCSSDDSEKIINEYLKKYENIKYIKNKKNQGIGYSRNLGILNSNSEYITFVDSDDYLDVDYLEKMYNFSKMNNLDMGICDLKKIDQKDIILGYEYIEKFQISNLEINPNLLLIINLGPTNKLFKSELFKDKKNLFSEKLKYEDIYCIPTIISKSNKIGKIDNVYYNYVIHSNSQTTTVNEKIFDILEVLKKVYDDLNKLIYYDKIREHTEYLFIRTLFRYTLQQRFQVKKDIKNKFIDYSFDLLNTYFPDWKTNKIWKSNRSFIKRIIEGNKIITKIYVNI